MKVCCEDPDAIFIKSASWNSYNIPHACQMAVFMPIYEEFLKNIMLNGLLESEFTKCNTDAYTKMFMRIHG